MPPRGAGSSHCAIRMSPNTAGCLNWQVCPCQGVTEGAKCLASEPACIAAIGTIFSSAHCALVCTASGPSTAACPTACPPGPERPRRCCSVGASNQQHGQEAQGAWAPPGAPCRGARQPVREAEQQEALQYTGKEAQGGDARPGQAAHGGHRPGRRGRQHRQGRRLPPAAAAAGPAAAKCVLRGAPRPCTAVQRKNTLLVEYKQLRKSNAFIDRRFGGTLPACLPACLG